MKNSNEMNEWIFSAIRNDKNSYENAANRYTVE